MTTISNLKQKVIIALQNHPDLASRYNAGDMTVVAHIDSFLHTLVQLARDVEISELEPFVKSKTSTIIADAVNKGILPLATPFQHYIEIKNAGKDSVVLQANRYIQDGRGRKWRLLQYAEIPVDETVTVLAEQSEVRPFIYTATQTEIFHQFAIPLQDQLKLVSLSVTDNEENSYAVAHKWMNVNKGDKSYVLKANSLNEVVLEFGDSDRFGSTLEANTELTIMITETDGEIDHTNLREASLIEIKNGYETKLSFRFKDDGVVQLGANPLSINHMRLLASYPTYDSNAVFLGDFDFLVRKNCMNRLIYSNVWNESIHEKYYQASVHNINKLFVSFMPKNELERSMIQEEISQLIARADSLYSDDNVVFLDVEERLFNINITALLSPIHDEETVKDQIKTLLVSLFGKGQLSTSYHVSNGFNLQEMAMLIRDNIVAFQDRQSDFKIYTDDLDSSPVLPNQLLYISADSISFDIKRLSSTGGGLWSRF